jgi:DNA mismatch repair protein MutL
MSGVIVKLPDVVANQIAAGEVIQRPASVVKELMENAIDAGAKKIKVVIKDAGRTLIFIEDNGHGMSPSDAVLCFERHATSKLKSAEDLFKIATKGFRGEALASVAAIAHVELKTKMEDATEGTRLLLSAGRVELKESCSINKGTQFSIKNLFYNVPARRYFLKSDNVEWKHILEEFYRVALVHPQVEMVLEHNGHSEIQLSAATFKQRIVKLMGNKFDEWLVPIEEETQWLQVSGFLSKPDAAKKTRGDQYFFVNGRFIKHPYLHHAIQTVYQGLIKEGTFPAYFVQIEVDPSLIDVNIHPTKTEIKFQDDKAVYAILHAAARRALGMHNIVPTIDFNQEGNFVTPVMQGTEIKVPTVQYQADYNPFGKEAPRRDVVNEWLKLQAEIHSSIKGIPDHQMRIEEDASWDQVELKPIQILKKWVVFEYNQEMWMIDQGLAHRQIQFESWMKRDWKWNTQALMAPVEMAVGDKDRLTLKEVSDELKELGYQWELAENNVLLKGVPNLDASVQWERQFGDFISNWDEEYGQVSSSKEMMAWLLAKKEAIRGGQMLTTPEMKDLIVQLLQCENPFFTPNHKKIIFKFNEQNIQQFFRI